MCAVLILGEVGKGDVCSSDIGEVGKGDVCSSDIGEGGCVQF